MKHAAEHPSITTRTVCPLCRSDRHAEIPTTKRVECLGCGWEYEPGDPS